VVVDSDHLIFHEATTGPFCQDNTDFRNKRIDQNG
jgi:hypothetical protein